MNISQLKASKLEERMTEFALSCIGISRQTPKSVENRIILDQLIRSSSSIGANYSEANNAISKQDFRNKIYLSKKEAAESRYWLRLLSRANPDLLIDEIIDECTQILLILQKSVTTLQNAK